MSKTLVIYSYYQKNDEYVKNFEFFIHNGIYSDIDYIFCINGRECSITIPDLPNIKILPRDNHDYDFGAYADALKTIDMNTYDYFFFINTSVRGPFLPEEIRSTTRWTKPFLKLLTGDVKLVGTSINILNVTDENTQKEMSLNLLTEKGYNPPFPHVQSQVFLLDREGLKFIMSKDFFNQSAEGQFVKFIVLREVMLSQLILKNGWNINCLLPKYQGLNYKTISADINETSVNGDPYYIGAYFGGTIRPYDVMFIKTNRNVSTDEIIKLTDDYYIYNTHPTNYIETFDGGNINSIGFERLLNKTMKWFLVIVFIAILITLFYMVYKNTQKTFKRYRKK
jgi:hypothetical protein